MPQHRKPLVLIGSTLALALLASPAFAVYKVVGPDGKITYTDTPPPANGNAKVQAVAGAAGSGTPNTSGLPYELQQAAAKYPVTLYTSRDCAPCDSGRQLLQQRGIPFAEKTLSNAADQAALQRLASGNTLPVLTVGQQLIKGVSASEWNNFLDVAGYPRESKLPPSYRAPAPTPMTTPAPAPGTAAPAAPAGDNPRETNTQPSNSDGPNIKF